MRIGKYRRVVILVYKLGFLVGATVETIICIGMYLPSINFLTSELDTKCLTYY